MKFLMSAPLYLFALMAQSPFPVLGSDSIADGESNKDGLRGKHKINDLDDHQVTDPARSLLVNGCEGPPQKIRFRYRGGDCSQSNNLQARHDFDCVDYNGGPGRVPGTRSFIEVLDTYSGDLYFSNFVEQEAKIELNWYGEFAYISPYLTIRTYSSTSGIKLQETIVDLSCSNQLYLFDKFGSNQVIEWIEVSGRHVAPHL